MESKYTIIYKRSLADALNFMGLRSYVFTKDGKDVYSFEDNKRFKLALHRILQVRDEVRNLNLE